MIFTDFLQVLDNKDIKMKINNRVIKQIVVDITERGGKASRKVQEELVTDTIKEIPQNTSQELAGRAQIGVNLPIVTKFKDPATVKHINGKTPNVIKITKNSSPEDYSLELANGDKYIYNKLYKYFIYSEPKEMAIKINGEIKNIKVKTFTDYTAGYKTLRIQDDNLQSTLMINQDSSINSICTSYKRPTTIEINKKQYHNIKEHTEKPDTNYTYHSLINEENQENRMYVYADGHIEKSR